MKQLKELPEAVRDEILNTLKAYDRVDVYFGNGEYHFGLVIKNHYAADHKFIGTYYAKDIYTEDERILNYVNEFRCYPIEYKGKRDYRIFHNEKPGTFIMVNGNIELSTF